ncbi:MAG: hypothetical protein GKR87_04565 [Kiritimatiellae bacterium]|nr:hypothetical protein [Kiritimatiellia bacterium]
MAYSYNIPNPPILPRTLKVDDGTYTWDEVLGSSNPIERKSNRSFPHKWLLRQWHRYKR